MFFDLERQAAARTAFEGDLGAKRIISNLEQLAGRSIDPQSTLIVLDEIQTSERALAAQYLDEELESPFVIVAGSLLSVAVSCTGYSAPTGKVETMTLPPMEFDKQLEAVGRGDMIAGIEQAYADMRHYDLHEEALRLFRSCLLCGGMPEAVSSFARNGSVADVADIQHQIISLYIADMAKHAELLATARIREAWNSIPAQLAKENRRFQYRVVHQGGRASQYASALDWLETAGPVVRCVRISSGQIPLKMQEDRSSFKVYMTDTGLLCAMMEIPPAVLFDEEARRLPDIGSLTENYIAQCLVAGGFVPRYWTSGRSAEIDFVIEDDSARAVPVEVKSSGNVRSRSLSVYREKHHPQRSIRFAARNFGNENGIESLPFYAAFCLRRQSRQSLRQAPAKDAVRGCAVHGNPAWPEPARSSLARSAALALGPEAQKARSSRACRSCVSRRHHFPKADARHMMQAESPSSRRTVRVEQEVIHIHHEDSLIVAVRRETVLCDNHLLEAVIHLLERALLLLGLRLTIKGESRLNIEALAPVVADEIYLELCTVMLSFSILHGRAGHAHIDAETTGHKLVVDDILHDMVGSIRGKFIRAFLSTDMERQRPLHLIFSSIFAQISVGARFSPHCHHLCL